MLGDHPPTRGEKLETEDSVKAVVVGAEAIAHNWGRLAKRAKKCAARSSIFETHAALDRESPSVHSPQRISVLRESASAQATHANPSNSMRGNWLHRWSLLNVRIDAAGSRTPISIT